jgi:ATP-GRASP peptide maturase of grasp-with-spasm system
MVLIFSEESDYSTTEVCRWMFFLKTSYIRIDQEFTIDIKYIKVDNNDIDFLFTYAKEKTISLASVSFYWYRRGRFRLVLPELNEIKDIDIDIQKKMLLHIQNEFSVISEYFDYKMLTLKNINCSKLNKVNKLIVLDKASVFGLKIPKTIVTHKKKYVSASIQSSKIITKSISEGFQLSVFDEIFITYTEGLQCQNIEHNQFGLSLFQEKIDKEADIRIFYILGEFYPMAIMSQNNAQTETDFRKYDRVKPNRKFPFKLPNDVESKIHLLMKDLDLESGSIDMVFTQDGEFVFLEVNPIGQFGMTSYPCNYFLEKIIAKRIAIDMIA